ncbi:hypothetical protein MKX01_021091 [Papaver californicum]|nr:hypothetical protein MKX01_021091 [Papaver californicum]
MEAQQISRIFISNSLIFSSHLAKISRNLGSVKGMNSSLFPVFSERISSCNGGGRFLSMRRSVNEKSKGSGGFNNFQDEILRSFEDKNDVEVIFEKQIDQSMEKKSQSGSKEFVESITNIINEGKEGAVDADKEEKHHTKVTHSIVFVTAQAAPYSKTGGLGDVCGSLPITLASRGHRVMVISPRYLNGTPAYKNFDGAVDTECKVKISCFGSAQEVQFHHGYKAGVDWVFVDHPAYHRPGNPYGDVHGAFGDNQFRFALLCHAACEAPLVLPLGGFTYGEKCLFLANDWHAGLVPVLLGAKYRSHGVYKDARSIIVIHNLAHQGVEPAITFKNLGLPADWYGALEWVFPTWARTHALDTGEAVNILKGAIVTADRIMTVSQAECKAALQKELSLPIKPECPMIGFIGRLDYQKGIDLIRAAMPELLEDDVQFVMLGSGDKQTEDWMRATETANRDKFIGWVGFNVPISHRITAGSDILLMPSRFEPCGLNQLYAMRYGTIPVDTVESFNPYAQEGSGQGTGTWTFSPLTKDCMLEALRTAIGTYKEHESSWKGIMKRGMAQDYAWDNAAVQYEEVFEWAFADPPYIR